MVDQAQLQQLVKAVIELSPGIADRLAYSLNEAAKVTGIPVKQLRFAIGRKELRAKRIGKRLTVTRDNLLRWLDAP